MEACVADMNAVIDRDPACSKYTHCMLNFKGFQAVQVGWLSTELRICVLSHYFQPGYSKDLFRLAVCCCRPIELLIGFGKKIGRCVCTCVLFTWQVPLVHFFYTENKQIFQALAHLLQSRISEKFHVDIHPAAKVICLVIGSVYFHPFLLELSHDIQLLSQIGRGIMIDHASGVVIGETAVVGDNVSILHHVTLGGSGISDGKRHPQIGKPLPPHGFRLRILIFGNGCRLFEQGMGCCLELVYVA